MSRMSRLIPAFFLGALAAAQNATWSNFTFTAVPTALNVAGGAPKTEIAFSPCSDHWFVIDKAGRLTVLSKTAGETGFSWDNTADTYQYADHGPLGMVLHPNFPTQPYLFIFYTKDTGIDSVPWNDTCPRVIDTRQFCQTTQKLVRLKLDVTLTNGVCKTINYTPGTNPPFVLKEDWCSNSITHANGGLSVYRGDLLLTSGDGAQAGGRDVGIPVSDTCYDDAMKMPQGKLRSQRLDYLNGKLLRIPAAALLKTTGQLVLNSEIIVVARGLRNPYALTVDKNFNVYIGDVGSKLKEEINMLRAADMNAVAAYPYNFGWPCIQGSRYITEVAEQDWLKTVCDPATAAVGGCDLCKDLYPCIYYAAGVGNCTASWKPPAFEFRGIALDSDFPDECQQATTSITGLAFLDGSLPQFGAAGASLYPYNLIASDYGTGCMFTFPPKADQTPDFAAGAKLLVTEHKHHLLVTGKDGYLYSTRTELFQTVWKHGVKLASDGPSAELDLFTINAAGSSINCGTGSCQVTVGTTVRMDASSSTQGGSAIITYAFDFGDGSDPITQSSSTADKMFATAGTYTLSVTVTDATDQTSYATRTLAVGSTMSIVMTPATNLWKLGEKISYSLVGMPAGASVVWDASVYHCGVACNGQADCHRHTNGVDGEPTLATGTITPPTHDLPSYMEVTATVTNTAGQSVDVLATTHCLTYAASIKAVATGVEVAGFVVDNGEVAQCVTPCEQPFMAKSAPTLIARRVQAKSSKIYKFVNWKKTLASNGKTSAAGATPTEPSNDITIIEDKMVLTATYERVFPTASAEAVPILVAAKGFYKSIEVMWVVPVGVTWDYVIVSVVSNDNGADFSVALPAGGDFFTKVTVPDKGAAATYSVKLAGYAYGVNTLTVFGQIRTATVSTSIDDLCYPSPGAYNAVVITLPGTVEAEKFMMGGPGIAYYDTTAGNSLGANFRTGNDVDILVGGSVGAGTEYSVGNTVGGEWLQFLVKSKLTRKYYVDFVVRSDTVAHKDLFLQVDTAVCQFSTATVKVEQTGLTNGKWITLRSTNRLSLTAGQHVLRFCVGGGNVVLDRIVLGNL